MADPSTDLAEGARSVSGSSPMFFVPDMRATVRWYESIGFTVADAYEDEGALIFARLRFGHSEFTLSPGGSPGPRDVRLWFFTHAVEDLYRAFKNQQLRTAEDPASVRAGGIREIRFEEELYEPFYGGRQFSIRDINGLALIFWQPEWMSGAAHETRG
jgi:hypothetical protein